jgi:hypothetical protein
VTQFEALVRDAVNDVRTSGGYAMVFAAGANSAMLAADRVARHHGPGGRAHAHDRRRAARRRRGSDGAGSAGGKQPGASERPVAAPAGAARPRTTPPGN